MYLDKALIKGNVNEFVKYGVEIMFPINGFNSSGAQEFADRYINGTLPTQYNVSYNSRDVIKAIVDYADINTSISNILFWGYDNEKLHSQDPNLYFKTLLQGLLNNFIIPQDAKEFSEYVLSQVTIAKNLSSSELRPMIRDFIGSKYIPSSMVTMVDEITDNEANWKQFTDKTYSAVIPALQWKFMEHELSQQYTGTQFEHEFNYVQRLLSNYVLVNFTAILYIDQVSGTNYLFDQINAFVNTTEITDGYKDLYTILLKLPKENFGAANFTSTYNELSSFFKDTDIINSSLAKAASELFEMTVANNASIPETKFWIEIREYVDSLNLATSTRAWFEENIQQKDIKSFKKLDKLFYPDKVEIGGIVWSTGDLNLNNLQDFILLLIDISDKDTITFGDFKGPYWPNNVIDNANRIASNVKYVSGNNSEADMFKFTNSVFVSFMDMYTFEYPFTAYVNITAQMIPKLVSDGGYKYYFGYSTCSPANCTDFPGKPEEFIKDSLTIVENTLDNTLNMRDLIDIGQLYVDVNKINDTTFDGIINFVCEQNKDIAITLCTVLKMVNSTVSLIEDFINGAKNFTYKSSITDIKNTFDLPQFLPFLKDFVDALVGSVYPKESATIISTIQATDDYWMTSPATSTEIVNLTHCVGNLYLLDDEPMQTQWDYTMIYVEEAVYEIETLPENTNIDDYVYNLEQTIVTLSPTDTPAPTKIGETKLPTKLPTNNPTILSSTPTYLPTLIPTFVPTLTPTKSTLTPTSLTIIPTSSPICSSVTCSPTFTPTLSPSMNDTINDANIDKLIKIQDSLSTQFIIVTLALAGTCIFIAIIGFIDAKWIHPNDIFNVTFVVFPFFYLYDQVSDVFASINIYYEYKYMSITNYNILLILFMISMSFIIIPSILSLIQLSRAVNKLFITDKHAGQAMSKWMLDYSYLMYLSSIIFGSSFGSLYFLNVMYLSILYYVY